MAFLAITAKPTSRAISSMLAVSDTSPLSNLASIGHILLRAKAQGQIAAIKPEMDALRVKAGFFVPRALEQQILGMPGELKG